MSKLVFDIGASNMKFAVMTEEGEILSRSSVPTPRDSLESYLNALCTAAEEHRRNADGVAVSTNGRMVPDGDTYRAYTMDFLVGVNLKKELESRLRLPVSIENDGHAAALGEWWKGAGQGTSNMMGVVLGSGMGAGLILDGKLHRGARRNGAMIFGMLSVSDPENEKYLASGITTSFPVVTYMTAAAKGMQPGSISGPELFHMAGEGDALCLAMLEKYYRHIAVSIFNSAVLLDLDCVVLTGGLASQKMVVEGVRRQLEEIASKAFVLEGMDLSSLGIKLDLEDFAVDLRPGRLCLDANLYGALYRHLHPA